MTEMRKFTLSTGVTLNLALAGNSAKPAVILLHGFPKSHRTWREIVPRLQDDFFLVMPDQRGFAGSDLPQDVEDYKIETLIDDIFALADALGIGRFALVGHDWGGAIAWGAALRGDPRLTRLAIINAPHPVIFQKSVIENTEQRAASKYITAFRAPGIREDHRGQGLRLVFRHELRPACRRDEDPRSGAAAIYRRLVAARRVQCDAQLVPRLKVVVPPPGVTVPLPDFLLRAFPSVKVPALVIWGMRDQALYRYSSMDSTSWSTI